MLRENIANRGMLGAGILAAHVGLFALVITSTMVRPLAKEASVAVSFLEQTEKVIEQPRLQSPELAPIHTVLVPPPEVTVAVEPEAAITATAAEVQPAPALAMHAQQAVEGVPVHEMSEVAYLVRPAPRYPPESRKIREQGLVVLRVLIDEKGRAQTVEIYRSSGHPRLDEAARRAVAGAVFKPYVEQGVARASSAIVPIEFSLRAAAS